MEETLKVSVECFCCWCVCYYGSSLLFEALDGGVVPVNVLCTYMPLGVSVLSIYKSGCGEGGEEGCRWVFGNDCLFLNVIFSLFLDINPLRDK